MQKINRYRINLEIQLPFDKFLSTWKMFSKNNESQATMFYDIFMMITFFEKVL